MTESQELGEIIARAALAALCGSLAAALPERDDTWLVLPSLRPLADAHVVLSLAHLEKPLTCIAFNVIGRMAYAVWSRESSWSKATNLTFALEEILQEERAIAPPGQELSVVIRGGPRHVTLSEIAAERLLLDYHFPLATVRICAGSENGEHPGAIVEFLPPSEGSLNTT